METRLPPLVLVFDEARVGPADDHRGQHVRAAPQMRRQIELGGQPRVFRQPDEHAVHVHEQHAVGRADVQHDAPVAPAATARERSAVESGRIVRRRRTAARTEMASRRSCSADGRGPAAPTCPALECRPRSNHRGPIAAKSSGAASGESTSLKRHVPSSDMRHGDSARRARRFGRRIRRQRHAHRQTIQRNALRLLPHRRFAQRAFQRDAFERRRFRRDA